MTLRALPFGNAFEIQLGKMLDREKNVGELQPYLGNRDVQWGNCNVSGLERMRFTKADREKYALVPGDLLVCEGGEVGRTAIWNGEIENCYYQKAIHRLRPKQHVEPRFVFHFMRWAASRGLFARLTSATSIAHLTKAKLKELQLPLPHKNGKPDLDEQKRIAAILDKADAIRRKRQQALRLTDDFLRSVFLDMFGDPEGKGWMLTTVEGMLLPKNGSIRTGPFGSQLRHGEFVESGIAVLGIDNAVANQFAWAKPRFITTEKYSELKRYTVHPGDVLITIMGTCGRCAVVPNDIPTAINTKHLCCITLDHKKCLPQFLHAYFLIHPLARRYLTLHSKGAIMDGLNMAIIKGLPVPCVPIALQREFVRLVAQRSKTSSRLTAQSSEAERLFAALQQRAFRGEL